MAYIRKLESGRYQVQVRRHGFKTISKTFARKRDARAFEVKIESDTELFRNMGVSSEVFVTFESLTDLYIAQYKGRDPSTECRLRYWCVRFGKKVVTQITAEDVDDGLIAKSKKVTGSTVNRYKSTLSAVFIYFIQHPEFKRSVRQLKFTNPVRDETVSKFALNRPISRFLSQSEQKDLLIYSKQTNWDRLYLIVLMALTTGCRKGELLRLTWTDIDFKQKTAYLGVTKNGKPRYVPLTLPVREELLKFRGEPDHLIFHNTKCFIKPYDFKKQWYNARRESNLDDLRFHDLRHTSASNLVRAGRTLFEVGTLLGHSSTQMTARYSHLAIHDTIEMVDSVMGHLA